MSRSAQAFGTKAAWRIRPGLRRLAAELLDVPRLASRGHCPSRRAAAGQKNWHLLVVQCSHAWARLLLSLRASPDVA
ncbi:hypothetical protein SKAU_G00429790 [Synaphobranchus kaupii]|uniref:Uncharacterized protein n=1 Tax=Synaphobranchus kaupii TaxID=118154 RepID=A0A9Q1I9X8_SYNKA|nr:hypothetical protein SKAU_G00429790 [Synaphobranchus kaupii]